MTLVEEARCPCGRLTYLLLSPSGVADPYCIACRRPMSTCECERRTAS